MTLKKLLPGCFLATGLVFALPLSSWAVDLSATEITDIQGRVEVRKGADAAFKKLNSNLKLSGALKRLDGGDKVRTHVESSAEMALKDTCILAVKEQSIFEVPRTLGKDAITELKAQQGALLFKVISGSNFQVQTADVIAGVKGTLFELNIIDNFDCLLETPGLQIGTIAPGGTMVNVYKGEVELTHAQTGKKRTLKAGDGIAAIGSSLLKFDAVLKDGFTPLRNFDPATLLSEKFGEGALGLLETSPTLSGLTEFAGVGNVPAALGDNRFSEMLTGLGNPLIEKLKAVEEYTRDAGAGADEIIDTAKYYEERAKNMMGEKFKFDFSAFNREEQPFTVSDRNFRDVYLGSNTFAACKANAGSKTAKVEPAVEGLLLNDGNSLFKFKKYNNVTPVIEFLAAYQQNGTNLTTTVKLIKGELYGRIPGDIKSFKIPGGLMSYSYDTATGKGELLQAAAGAIPDDLNKHFMKVEERMAREKGQHEHKTETKRIDTVKDAIKNPGKFFKKLKF